MIDLHTHTNASDGELSFNKLISEAKNAKLTAIAITDHDTINKKLMEKDAYRELEVIPGVELSIFDRKLNYMDVHILGLFIDPKNKNLNYLLKTVEKDREEQKKLTIEKLNEQGYEINFEEIREISKCSISRVHIAKILVKKYPIQFPDIRKAFEKVLDNGKLAYVERVNEVELENAITTIDEAGGLSFIAHPFQYEHNLERLLKEFRGLGGNGIETYYDYESNDKNKSFINEDCVINARKLAIREKLLECGGSDFHGKQGQKLGKIDIPEEILWKLKTHLDYRN